LTLLTDALGSVIAQAQDVAGQAGNPGTQVTEGRFGYTPYGETAATGENGTSATAVAERNANQYTARENDALGAAQAGLMGLYYYRARYYDPVLKRFIAEDPIGLAGGMNVYGYVGGDPVFYVDPNGFFGVFAGVKGSATGLFMGGDVGAKVILGNEGTAAQVVASVGGNLTTNAFGLQAGLGPEAGQFKGDISDFLKSDQISIDTPVGGISLYFNPKGEFSGLSIGGPSLGMSVSGTGPTLGKSDSREATLLDVDLSKIFDVFGKISKLFCRVH
jgi:RHS repeat-associated protein